MQTAHKEEKETVDLFCENGRIRSRAEVWNSHLCCLTSHCQVCLQGHHKPAKPLLLVISPHLCPSPENWRNWRRSSGTWRLLGNSGFVGSLSPTMNFLSNTCNISTMHE
jgi:hypothetical protein